MVPARYNDEGVRTELLMLDASGLRSSASRSGFTAARTMKLDCGVIPRYSKTSSPVGS